MKFHLLALAPLGIVAACAAAPAAIPPSTHTLQPAASASLGGGHTLRYERLSDSRCPRDVVCITAGELAWHFTLTSAAGAEAFVLSAAQPSFQSGTVRIALAQAADPPLRAASDPAPAYPVTVDINTP